MIPPFFVEQPEIVTERLLLRKLRRDDAADIFEYCSREAVTRRVLITTQKTIADAEAFLARILDQKFELGVVWGIVWKETGKLIGTIGIHQINLMHQSLEVAYALHDEYWGKGIVAEAVITVIAAVFTNTEINRISAIAATDHPRSCRVLEKAGMSFEGILRKAINMKDGFQDMRQYSILREEYV